MNMPEREDIQYHSDRVVSLALMLYRGIPDIDRETLATTIDHFNYEMDSLSPKEQLRALKKLRTEIYRSEI
jgi:hypothetical protein